MADEEALAARQRELDAREQALDARSAELAAAQQERRASETVEFAQRLTTEGRILPRHTEGIAQVLASLEAEEFTVELAAENPGGPKRSQAGSEFLREFLGSLPEQVPYGEAAPPREGESRSRPRSATFAAPHGATVDKERLRLHERAVELATEKDIDYGEATVLAAREMEG